MLMLGSFPVRVLAFLRSVNNHTRYISSHNLDSIEGDQFVPWVRKIEQIFISRKRERKFGKTAL